MCYNGTHRKIDVLKLSTEAQQQLRHQAIRLRKAGKMYQQIAEVTGVHFTTVCKWYSAYLKHGAEAVKLKKRGRPKGTCRILIAGLIYCVKDELRHFPMSKWKQ